MILKLKCFLRYKKASEKDAYKKINLLKDKLQEGFEVKVIGIVEIRVFNLGRHFKDVVFKTCDEGC